MYLVLMYQIQITYISKNKLILSILLLINHKVMILLLTNLYKETVQVYNLIMIVY
jgi:hypothetical protein